MTGHRIIARLIPAVLVVLLRFSILGRLPIPEPMIHDEFSYLLGADTLASGRLTNAPHPMWVHFETFHVNQQPTYATKYQPGQSLFLALGQRVFGHPWYGVLVSVSLMCACISWMLQGWLPLNYAMLGSLIAVVQFGLSHYWINSYWGGALPAAGGALVLGAIPRLLRRPSSPASLLGSFGVAILAMTRPYEGLIVTAASLGALHWWSRHAGRRRHLLKPTVLVPAAVVLTSLILWMGYYNYRVTGDPFLMPFVVNQSIYSAAPHFWFLPEGSIPTYRHDVLREFWVGWDRNVYLEARAAPSHVVMIFIAMVLSSYPLPVLLFALVAVTFGTSRTVRIMRAITVTLAIGLLLEKGLAPHYYAPVTAAVLLLACAEIRRLLRLIPVVRLRYVAAVSLAALLLISSAITTFKFPADDDKFKEFAAKRRAVREHLLRQGTHHLVIVRYSPDHDVHTEWVYNSADIDHSAIVWARDMGQTSNAEISRYYQDRTMWVLEPDVTPPRLTRYPTGQD